MKVEFTVTADLETGEFTVTCPEVFELKNKGWGAEVRTNYPGNFKKDIPWWIDGGVRATFMKIAQMTKDELEKAEVQS